MTNTGGCVTAPALPAPMALRCVLCPFPKQIPGLFGSLGLVPALAPSILSREIWEIRPITLVPLSLAAPALRKKKKKKLMPAPDVSHTNIPNLDEVAMIQPFPSALDLVMRRNLMPCVTEIPNKSPLGPVPFPGSCCGARGEFPGTGCAPWGCLGGNSRFFDHFGPVGSAPGCFPQDELCKVNNS